MPKVKEPKRLKIKDSNLSLYIRPPSFSRFLLAIPRLAWLGLRLDSTLTSVKRASSVSHSPGRESVCLLLHIPLQQYVIASRTTHSILVLRNTRILRTYPQRHATCACSSDAYFRSKSGENWDETYVLRHAGCDGIT